MTLLQLRGRYPLSANAAIVVTLLASVVWMLLPPRAWAAALILALAAIIYVRAFLYHWRKRRRDRKLLAGCLAGLLRIASMVRTLGERAKPKQRLIPQPDPV
jgi:uncharacterized protein involved in response to NO